MNKTSVIKIPIYADIDIIASRQRGRELAEAAGFSDTDVTLIATVISEVARKIVEQPLPGEMTISITREAGSLSIVLVARIHLSDKTIGVEVTPGCKPLDGFDVLCKAEETVLKLRQPRRVVTGGASLALEVA